MTEPKVCNQKFTCAATGPMRVYQCALPRGHEGECDDHPTRAIAMSNVEAGDRALETPTPEQFKLWEAACDYCRIDGWPAKRSDGKWMHYYEHEDPSECLAGAVAESAMNAQERGKPTPDGGALVNPTAQQEEWIAAIEQAECQVESFAPLTLTNIKALRLREALGAILPYVEKRGDAAKLLAVGKAERLLAERGEGHSE